MGDWVGIVSGVTVQLVLVWSVGLVWLVSACRLDLCWGSGRLARCRTP